LGGWDKLLEILVLSVVIDYGTGVIKALCLKQLSPEIGYRGILKKVGIFVVVVLAVQIDKLVGQTNIVRRVVCLLYISNEGISILRNVASSGTFVPEYIKNIFLELMDKASKGGIDKK
jgi:toxin secretion/phage lysis holin